MRFEELAYRVDGLPVTVGFHARLTVISLPAGDERAQWVARLLGVLEGVRPGDGATLVYVDHAGRRVRLERDEQGSATLTDLATGEDLPYSAAHLSLDGRFDWFASVGVAARRASDAIVVDPDAFTGGGDYDRAEAEARLAKARRRLGRVEARRQAATARSRQCGDRLRRIAELDEQIDQEARGSSTTPSDSPTAVPGELTWLAAACRTAAERRDELIARLDALREAGSRGDGGPLTGAAREAEDAILRQLVDEVEPAYADALLAFADACRPLGVIFDAVRIEAAGVGSTGVAVLMSEVLAEVAAGAPELKADPAEDRRMSAEMEAERSRLIDELHRIERGLPDEAELARRHSVLEQSVAALAASLEAGRWLVSAREAETILRRRAEKTGRVGRSREPLPLVVDDALSPFASSDKQSVLEVLSGVGETTQVVYLTDDADTLMWASGRAETGEIGLWRPDGIASVA